MTRFFVGDLCYVLEDKDWDVICANFPEGDDPEVYLEPEEFDLEDNFAGRPCAVLSTAYGDGCYNDLDGNPYSVDSGTIGCIRVEDIRDQSKLERALELGLGHVHEFDEAWYLANAESVDGVLIFGDVEIDTN